MDIKGYQGYQGYKEQGINSMSQGELLLPVSYTHLTLPTILLV